MGLRRCRKLVIGQPAQGPISRRSERPKQALERDNKHTLLPALHAASAGNAKDRHGPMAAPPSSEAPQPRHLLAHQSEVPVVIRRCIRFDREGDAARRDRDLVDVASPGQPTALASQRRERARDLVLGVRADAAEPSERKPVARVKGEGKRDDKEGGSERKGCEAPERKGEQRRGDTRD